MIIPGPSLTADNFSTYEHPRDLMENAELSEMERAPFLIPETESMRTTPLPTTPTIQANEPSKNHISTSKAPYGRQSAVLTACARTTILCSSYTKIPSMTFSLSPCRNTNPPHFQPTRSSPLCLLSLSSRSSKAPSKAPRCISSTSNGEQD